MVYPTRSSVTFEFRKLSDFAKDSFNFLPNFKILDWFKFADDKMNVGWKMKSNLPG